MIFFNWNTEEDSHIGRSHCKQFVIEISPVGGQFIYRIINGDMVHHSLKHKYDSVEEAKKIAVSIVALQNSM